MKYFDPTIFLKYGIGRYISKVSSSSLRCEKKFLSDASNLINPIDAAFEIWDVYGMLKNKSLIKNYL